MVETIHRPVPVRESTALHQLATVVLNEHTNDHGLCVICGSAWPCDLTNLADHNVTLTQAH